MEEAAINKLLEKVSCLPLSYCKSGCLWLSINWPVSLTLYFYVIQYITKNDT
jgi:hypothetical protein